MSPQDVAEYFAAGKSAIEIFREIRGLIPSGRKRDELDAQIERAERAFRLSEAAAAKALGYELCQCKFPPEIMRSVGYHPVHGHKEVFVCPSCKKQKPPQAYFDSMDQTKAYNDSLPPAGFRQF